MSKLSLEEKFIDVSDYGRPIAVHLASRLQHTSATPVQVTLVFGLCGLTAVGCILNGFYATAGVFLIIKSIIDAVDGELARLKRTPSYTGRYLDSIFDYVLNFLVLLAVGYVADNNFATTLLAFACLQLQGTLYNYYYVILRHNSEGGDKTSNIFETLPPVAFSQENQRTVNILFRIYRAFYSIYDRIIYALEPHAPEAGPLPKWFMTLLSFYGLGFQLLIISVMLAAGVINLIIPFFIFYSIFIILLIAIRKHFLSAQNRS